MYHKGRRNHDPKNLSKQGWCSAKWLRLRAAFIQSESDVCHPKALIGKSIVLTEASCWWTMADKERISFIFQAGFCCCCGVYGSEMMLSDGTQTLSHALCIISCFHSFIIFYFWTWLHNKAYYFGCSCDTRSFHCLHCSFGHYSPLKYMFSLMYLLYQQQNYIPALVWFFLHFSQFPIISSL